MENNLIEINTPSGFSCVIDRSRFDDWEYVDIQASNDFRTEPRLMVFVMKKVLEKEDAERLKNMCRKPDGAVSAQKAGAIILELMKGIGEATKNSASSPA